MKSALLLLLLFCSNNLFSQPPAYFDNNQEWLTSFSFYSPGITDCGQNSTYVDYVNGDTIIGGTTYKKIGRRSSTSYFPMSSAPCPNDNWEDVPLYRLLRQSNDSIFEYSSQSGSEDLLITYNLSIGDSFSLTNFVTQNYSVQDIDTISLNGQDHRVFYVDTVNNYVVIEGIGHYSSENGGFLDFWGFGGGVDLVTSLNCYAQSGSTYWSHPDITLGSCLYLHDLSVASHVNNFEFQFFPNPVNDVVNVKSTQTISSIEIMSMTGASLIKQVGTTSSNLVNLTPLSKGIYIIIVRSSDGKQALRSLQKI